MGGIAMKGRPLVLSEAIALGETAIEWLKKKDGVLRAEIAGSVRRKKQTCGDVDIVAIPTVAFYNCFMELFAGNYRYAGPVKYTGMYREAQIDFLLTDEDSWGAAMMHATGSTRTNIAQRGIARSKGWMLNEKGLWKDDKKLCGATEKEVYEMLKINWLEPEAR